MPSALTRSFIVFPLLLLFAGCGKKEVSSPPSEIPATGKSSSSSKPATPPTQSAAEIEDPNETKAFELHEKYKGIFEYNVTAAEDKAGGGRGELSGLSGERAGEVVEGIMSKYEKVMAEVKAQPKEVQEIFFALMSGRGMKHPLISADGSHVAFEYDGTLYDPTDTDSLPDVYLWNLTDGSVRCVSQGGMANGKWACNSPALSKDGSILAFCSEGNGLSATTMPPAECNIYLRDLGTGGDPVPVADNPDWTPEGDFKLPTGMGRYLHRPTLSHDGNKLAFIASVASTRATEDVIGETYEALVLLDRTTKKYRALSKKVSRLSIPVISGDGSTVAMFGPPAAFLPDTKDETQCFLWLIPTDGSTPTQVVAPEGVKIYNGHAVPPSISADGSKIAIGTEAGDQPQVYLYDRAASQWTLVSANPSGKPCDAKSVEPSIAADGSAVAFVSYASDLLPGGKTLGAQTYRYDITTKQLSVMTVNGEGKPCQGVSASPSLNADGSRAAVLLDARDLPGVRLPKRQSSGVLMRLYVVDPKEKRYVTLGKALN